MLVTDWPPLVVVPEKSPVTFRPSPKAYEKSKVTVPALAAAPAQSSATARAILGGKFIVQELPELKWSTGHCRLRNYYCQGCSRADEPFMTMGDMNGPVCRLSVLNPRQAAKAPSVAGSSAALLVQRSLEPLEDVVRMRKMGAGGRFGCKDRTRTAAAEK
jgi:hypothetical protein